MTCSSIQPMMTQKLLHEAKAFLCWDKFHDLTIQLIPIDSAVAYFFPPDAGQKTILVFYLSDRTDYSEALFLLFHEAGHHVQYALIASKNMCESFKALMNQDKGSSKYQFEAEAWDAGRTLLVDFLSGHSMALSEILSAYDACSQRCLSSYAPDIDTKIISYG